MIQRIVSLRGKMLFINRKKELNQLESLHENDRKEMLILYGRRRLGKTTLLRAYSKKHSALFFSCPISTEKEALRLFQKQMAETFQEPLLSQMEFPGWPEAMAYAFEKADKTGATLIFDEFPYLMKSVPGIASIVQHLWDKTQESIRLIICGSLLSVMLEKVLGTQAPLYGRRTKTIHFQPMTFHDIALFYQHKKFDDIALWYACFGGIPAYAERASIFETPEKSLFELVLNPDGVLYQEPEFLVREELREPGAYFSILRSIADGKTRPNKIAQDAGIQHSGINKYLDTLRRMNIIERRYPITEKSPEKSTKSLYFLKDHFLRFWFRYVFQNRTIIELGNGKDLFQQKIQPDLDRFMGGIYEDMCHQEIYRRGLKIFGWKPYKTGRYWDGNQEIDLIVESANEQNVAFIECKWGKHIDIKRNLFKLKQKADKLPHYEGWKKRAWIMSRTMSKDPQHIYFGEKIG
ncbi:ArsR family transcriptional regulator [Candidatus Magnetomorum sp. HK-1]|nr:ArsR family transcriptional regulator [Candidatus Magnetomorum sp. HK-1]